MEGHNEDYDENQALEDVYFESKEALLFVIDGSSSMMSVNKELGKSPVRLILEAVFDLMRSFIIMNPYNLVGISFYNCQIVEDGAEESGRSREAYSLLDLDELDAYALKKLKILLDDEGALESTIIPSGDQTSVSTALSRAKVEFQERAEKVLVRRLFFFTDNDDPHKHESLDQRSVLSQTAHNLIRDLLDSKVAVNPFFIGTEESPFDPSLFFEDVFTLGQDSSQVSSMEDIFDGPLIKSVDLSELKGLIMDKKNLRRTLFRNTLTIDPLKEGLDPLKIGVKGYSMITVEKSQRFKFIYTGGGGTNWGWDEKKDGENDELYRNQEAVAVSKFLDAETGEEVSKDSLIKAYMFGGEFISFTKAQMEKIRNVDGLFDPTLKIIGFRSVGKLSLLYQNIRTSVFIYPNEDEYVNSIRAFSALYQSMYKKNKAAIVWGKIRANAAPTMFALVPSKVPMEENTGESESASGKPRKSRLSKLDRRMPEGFFLITLPFADDIRAFPAKHYNIEASLELKDDFKAIVKQLHVPSPYDPTSYSNPCLQWHYKVLESLALNESVPEVEDIVDKTVPKYSKITARAGKQLVAYNKSLEAETALQTKIMDVHAPAKKTTTSRKASKPPAEDVETPTVEEMKRKYESETIQKLTVKVLKAWLQKYASLPEDGTTKPFLVEAVQYFFRQQAEKEGKR